MQKKSQSFIKIQKLTERKNDCCFSIGGTLYKIAANEFFGSSFFILHERIYIFYDSKRQNQLIEGKS